MSTHPLYTKVLTYCARAERCPQEVTQWLEKREVSSAEIEEIIEELKEERYLDESRFIKAYTSDKLRFSERGPLRIKQELRMKNLPEGLIETLVDKVMAENDYRGILKAMLSKRLLSLDTKDSKELERKVLQWAYGKGFPWEDIVGVLKDIES